ncbi:unnamed protein product [Polarella glacialis]|uniref:proton-translocating NAD(P)(+) transhydrogenase n=1 Tax=Polarella glacialis TaxID=89957 RepID=A0A813D7J6_POLGL|nr:unnamed protein product [Polarella glacialis]
MSSDDSSSRLQEGYAVTIEPGAGVFAGFSDEAYVKATSAWSADLIKRSQVLFALHPPIGDFSKMKGKVLISWVGRLQETGKAVVDKANASQVTLIDVTAAPRITIAQKLDVLSSQAKVAGHRAVIEATHAFGRFHTGEMTAAGKYPPSQTFVLGVGVAGLAAIGTSKALGSVVRAWDVRDVSDQVHSMGAKWVSVDYKEDGAGQGGYAKESSDDFKKFQQETFKKVLSECDIAIATAAIPGRPSPLLITKEAVAAMKPGSVIIDLAALGGGNCELTRKDDVWTTPNGVTIIGYTDMPARMASQASAMYSSNMVSLMKHVQGKGKASEFLGNVKSHLEAGEAGDIVTRSIVCCRDGQLVKMPPPPQPTPVKPKVDVAAKKKAEAPSPLKQAVFAALTLTLGVCLALGVGEGVKASQLTTFLLAGAAGYQAVWGVAHSLHTPLMSVTNAISGMTAVGGLLLMQRSNNTEASILAMIGVAVSAVNIIGGFVVSQRMLNLFKKKGSEDWSSMMLVPGLIFIAVSLTHKELLGPVNTVSSVLCVAAIGALASQSTANAGCKLGMVGVFGALMATLVDMDAHLLYISLALLTVGGSLGLYVGMSVTPLQLPQTVAAFHSLVGFAAMSTSIGSFASNPEAGASMENISAVLGDFIGAVTFTGSIIAFGKLNGNLSSTPLTLPGKNFLNLAALLTQVGLTTVFLRSGEGLYGVVLLFVIALLACAMGVHLVGSVGGGDMPVCITVLNSYSGWALVLTVVGSLIGFSGAILTKIMCDAMNRDIFNVPKLLNVLVLFGGINNAPVVKSAGDEAPKVADLLASAKEVLVVPGYGMAMARAQTAMGEVANLLRANDINLKFGVHPVAGRMPGQMNVLLAEAGVPHEWVLEMDEVNPTMESVDVVLVVGANDVVNSAAQELEGCAIWGMPVIEVWRAKKVIFCKRSMAGGYADLDNPVFYKDNTDMLLGDAKKTADQLVSKVRERLERALKSSRNFDFNFRVPVKDSSAAAALVLAACHSLVSVDGSLSGDPIEVAALEAIGWAYDAEVEVAKPVESSTLALTDGESKDSKGSKASSKAGKHPVKAVQIVQRFHFASALQRMAVVVEVSAEKGDGPVPGLISGPGRYSLVKGSPEALRPLLVKDSAPPWFDTAHTELAESGLRVLALAYRALPAKGKDEKLTREEAESELTFAGFIAFECLSRADSCLVVGALRESGHKVAMLTGDSPLTALHISRTCGITNGTLPGLLLTVSSKDSAAVEWVVATGDGRDERMPVSATNLPELAKSFSLMATGDSLDAAVKAEPKLWESIDEIRIFARMTPHGKAGVIRELQKQGGHVLMCGDGGNDVGALKQADVGLALLAGYGNVNTTSSEELVPADGSKPVQGAEDALNERTKQLAKLGKRAGKERQTYLWAQQKILNALHQQWLQEEIEAKAQRGENGVFAQASAVKVVLGRYTEELKRVMKEYDLKHGNVYDAEDKPKAKDMEAKVKEMQESMDSSAGGLPMVRPGDASIAAPFTSKAPSVKNCVDLIRQGRCTLLSALQQQQIMMLNCIINAYVLSALSLEGSRTSERQMMASHWLLTTASLAFAYASPCDKMHPVRPLRSLFHPAVFVSMLGQAAIHLFCMVIAVRMARAAMDEASPERLEGWTGPSLKDVADFWKREKLKRRGLIEKEEEEQDWTAMALSQWIQPFLPNLMNTVVFLVETAQTVAILFVNYKGQPWMRGVTENRALFLSVFVVAGGVAAAAWEFQPQLNAMIHLSPFPNDEFRWSIMSLVALTLVGTFIWDKFCVYWFAPDIWGAMMDSAKKTTFQNDVLPIFITALKVAGVFFILGTGNLILAGLAFWAYKKNQPKEDE